MLRTNESSSASSSSDEACSGDEKKFTKSDGNGSSQSSSSSSVDESDHVGRDPLSQKEGKRSRSPTVPPGVVSRRKLDKLETSHADQLEDTGTSPKRRRLFMQRIDSLGSSKGDEDESESQPEGELRNTLDWDELADTSWAGKDCLFGSMPIQDISSLVGWATHFTSSGVNRLSLTEGSSQESLNPLLYLPSAPLPPSCLKFLSQAATDRRRAMMRQEAEISSDWGAAGKQQKRSKQRRTSSQKKTWAFNKDDETFNKFDSSKRSRNVQATMQESEEQEPRRISAANLLQSFDQSALVALGMVLEEALTASFLPLAKLHVARCRKLEQEQSQEPFNTKQALIHPSEALGETGTSASTSDYRNTSRSCGERSGDADAFHEWTLPPAEALMKLVPDVSLPCSPDCNGVGMGAGGLPSACPATAVYRRLMGDEDSDSLSSLQRSDQEEESCLLWCKAHGLDPSFLRDNMDVYGLFLPCAPPIMANSLVQHFVPAAKEDEANQDV